MMMMTTRMIMIVMLIPLMKLMLVLLVLVLGLLQATFETQEIGRNIGITSWCGNVFKYRSI